MSTSFWKAGHAPTLFASFLYFDLSFMVWYVLGPLGVQIAADLGLTTQQRAFMVATPILAGAVLRLALGILADRTSPKTAGLFGQSVVIVALLVAWLHGINSYEQALLLGLFLGMAGLLRRGATAGLAVVSGGTSGQGHGHRRRGQLRHRAGGAVRPGTGGDLRLEQCVRPGPDPAGTHPHHLRQRGEERAQPPGPSRWPTT